jgi:hypothetical protein
LACSLLLLKVLNCCIYINWNNYTLLQIAFHFVKYTAYSTWWTQELEPHGDVSQASRGYIHSNIVVNCSCPPINSSEYSFIDAHPLMCIVFLLNKHNHMVIMHEYMPVLLEGPPIVIPSIPSVSCWYDHCCWYDHWSYSHPQTSHNIDCALGSLCYIRACSIWIAWQRSSPMKGELGLRGLSSISKFHHHNINGGAVDDTWRHR